MICGYVRRTINEEYGLKEMREVCIAVPPDDLRALAASLVKVADELEGVEYFNWHRHLPESLESKLGCDFIVAHPKSGESDDA